MAFSFEPLVNTNIEDTKIIYANHVNEARNGVNTIAGWFTASGGVPGKIRLYSASQAGQTSEPSLLFPSLSQDPSTLTSGDFWNNSGVLKFQAGNTTKTIAFTDSAITTLSVSGTSTLTGAASLASTLAVTGASTFNNIAAVARTDENAFIVRKTDSGSAGATILKVNTNSNAVELRNAATFSVFNTSSVNPTFSVAGGTGNTTVGGALSAASINSSGAISRNDVAYAAPALLNTGGFTINLGTGITNISSGVQVPVVTIPYKCRIQNIKITTNDPLLLESTGGITIQLQRRAAGSTNSYTNFGPTFSLSSPSSQASFDISIADGNANLLQLALEDTIRVVTSGTITVKAVGIYVRVVRIYED
jgi:hypothetical protein